MCIGPSVEEKKTDSFGFAVVTPYTSCTQPLKIPKTPKTIIEVTLKLYVGSKAESISEFKEVIQFWGKMLITRHSRMLLAGIQPFQPQWMPDTNIRA
jgi:hypothetical protein